MTLEQAKMIKRNFMHLLGLKQPDGVVYTDIIIAPVDKVMDYLKEYICDFNEARCLCLFPSSEYGIIAIDRNLLKQGLFAYNILADVYSPSSNHSISPIDAIIMILKMNRTIDHLRDAEYEKLSLELYAKPVRDTIGDMRQLVDAIAIQRALSYHYEYMPAMSSTSELVFRNLDYKPE